MLLLLTACIENTVNPNDKDPDAFETGDDFVPPVDSDSDAPPPEEECNGEDDDGDGEVDEDFGDIDGDGVADCLDTTCTVDQPAPRAERREDCVSETGTPPSDPWSATLRWRAGEPGQGPPVVGDIDLDGVPEVVYQSQYYNLIVLDGATGAEEWRYEGASWWNGPSLGDIDGDGLPDVVGTTGECSSAHTIFALDNAGNELWTASAGNTCEPYPVLTDLEGDGDVEVILNENVYDGATGDLEMQLRASTGYMDWGVPAVADLDLDGRQEIILMEAVYDADGNHLFDCGRAGAGTFSEPVNIDGDDEGEVLVATQGKLTACDTDGTELWSQGLTGSYGTAVAVADFDGDGLQEFAVAEMNELLLIDGDGSKIWSTPIHDASGLSGCTSWDVDMDGVSEVIYADEQTLWVIDGATGDPRIEFTEHSSPTTSETPAVADVDGDGHGEIVFLSYAGPYEGVSVLSTPAGDWPWAPPVYNQHAYDFESISEDLQVVSEPTPSWLGAGRVFRGQPSAVFQDTSNLAATVADLCVASCEAGGAVTAWVQVWNDGPVAARSELVVYGRPGGVETEILRQTVDLDAGTSTELLVETTIDAVGYGLVVDVDGAAELAECDETDNRATWNDIGCP